MFLYVAFLALLGCLVLLFFRACQPKKATILPPFPGQSASVIHVQKRRRSSVTNPSAELCAFLAAFNCTASHPECVVRELGELLPLSAPQLQHALRVPHAVALSVHRALHTGSAQGSVRAVEITKWRSSSTRQNGHSATQQPPHNGVSTGAQLAAAGHHSSKASAEGKAGRGAEGGGQDGLERLEHSGGLLQVRVRWAWRNRWWRLGEGEQQRYLFCTRLDRRKAAGEQAQAQAPQVLGRLDLAQARELTHHGRKLLLRFGTRAWGPLQVVTLRAQQEAAALAWLALLQRRRAQLWGFDHAAAGSLPAQPSLAPDLETIFKRELSLLARFEAVGSANFAQFQAFVAQHPNHPPPHLLRFLLARQGHLAKAGELLQRDDEWRSSFPFLAGHEPLALRHRSMGYFYRQGSTLAGLPVLVWAGDRLRRKVAPPEEVNHYVVSVVEQTLRAMPPGVAHAAVLISAPHGTEVDLPTIRLVIRTLQDHYPCRLGSALVFPVGSLTAFFWTSFIRPCLAPSTRDKVLIGGPRGETSSARPPWLKELIAPTELEQRFGGQAVDTVVTHPELLTLLHPEGN